MNCNVCGEPMEPACGLKSFEASKTRKIFYYPDWICENGHKKHVTVDQALGSSVWLKRK